MLVLLLLLPVIISGIAIVDVAGVPQIQFAPGDVIKISFDKPGVYHVKVIDLRTGMTVPRGRTLSKSPERTSSGPPHPRRRRGPTGFMYPLARLLTSLLRDS